MDKKYYDASKVTTVVLKTIVTSYKDKNGVIINKDNLGVRWNGYIMNKFPQETMTTFPGYRYSFGKMGRCIIDVCRGRSA